MQKRKKTRTTLDILLDFFLALLVAIGVFLMTYADKLKGEAATGLMGMIIGHHLLGKDKK